jgi:hypothetical protein
MQFDLAGGEECVNVFHLDAPNNFNTQATAQTYVDTIMAGLYAPQGGLFANTTKSKTCRVTHLNQEGGSAYEVTPTTPFIGSGTTDALPNQVALVLSWRTNRSGRRYRGRTYLGGIVEAQSSEDAGGAAELPTATRDGLRTQAVTLLTNLRTASAPLAVFSRVGAGAVTQVNAVRVGNRFDTQRRRRSKMTESYSVGVLAPL